MIASSHASSVGQSSGQSILEVLFATTVVALVLVAILSTIIASLRNSRTSMEQYQATGYANEVLEWMRHERDSQGWVEFSLHLPSAGSTSYYCFDTLPTSIATIDDYRGECSGTKIPDTAFIRNVVLYRTSAEEVEATVTVSRPSRSGTTEVPLTGRFTQWQ